MKNRLFSGLAMAIAVGLTNTVMTAAAMTPNYGEALQKSIYFYEAQQAGKLPAWNRVPWRGDSVLNDGADVGIDLSGGWFDAGDHVKFGLPMAGSATMLAWGVVDYRSAYVRSGQLDEILNNLRFVNDYFIKAHPSPNVLYGQVGQGGPDHGFWGSPEVVEEKTGDSRIAYKIDLNCKGPDLAAETAAAMASSSMAFKSTDSAYSATLLTHARQLFDLALATVGTDGTDNKYSKCIRDAAAFYDSNRYWDEMAWGALWMYRATGESKYLTEFKTYYAKITQEEPFGWTQGWNNKEPGTYALAATLFGDSIYKTDTQKWLDFWIGPSGRKTPAGLMATDPAGWGTLRYAANTAFIAMYYADRLPTTDPVAAKYKQFAERQINYILGDNPRESSYMIGFGKNPPKNPHHRGAHGTWTNSLQSPEQSRHVLYGALVGGPRSTSDFDYKDDRGDFIANEVATDYNAGLTGALARMYGLYGGTPIPDSEFPPAAPKLEEFVVGGKVNATGPGFVEIRGVLQNKSASPAQVRRDLRFRYFVDLTELYAAGFSASDVTVSTAANQGSGITQLLPFGDTAKRIFYTEVAFDNVAIYPGGLSEFRKEVQFRLSVPTAAASAWNNANDPSWELGFSGNSSENGLNTPKIPVYSKSGKLLGGVEPAGGGTPPPSCGGTSGINCVPTATAATFNTKQDTPVSVRLAGTDSDGTITARTVVKQPTNGTVSGSGTTRTYTPKAGFSGIDSFTFTVTDNSNAVSAPATITINVSKDTPPPVNTAPKACFNVTTASPKAGAPVEFDASCSTDAENDPLTYTWDFGDSSNGTGPQAGHTYSAAGSYNVKVTVNDGKLTNAVTKAITVAPASGGGGGGSGTCKFTVENQWNSGFVGKITITNSGTSPINGWNVSWSFSDGSRVGNLWNASLSGSNPYTASNVDWNRIINPGKSMEFGFTANKGRVDAPAPTNVTVTGAVCK